MTLPPVAEPFLLPFHYGALHQVGIDYLVDPEPARAVLAKRHPGLDVAEFDGRACVSVNFQLYFAQYQNGGGITQEIEVNLVAVPRGAQDRVSSLTYPDYASGVDTSGLLGIGRLHVLCDNDIAIRAGTLLFAEPKYPARFEVSMPSLNGPATSTWSVDCLGHFAFTARLDGLPATPVHSAPITGYGTTEEGRLLAGPMNVYQPCQLYHLDDPDRITLTVTDPSTEVCTDLTTMIGTAPAVAAWTFQSTPVAAHNRPYYQPFA
ncbi:MULTISPECIES: hypothetical protein [Catenuloplanes]|uniref:Acetoacetate decarboxylase n=1 Tax=Catenuloplanes niger TaxID=587534 RepID=A0AAE3ZJS7_9ACTN|nr:hypothetical protein [Catenuloplanes niger]MDR7319955.1 hypothetical protein [Catenuloplanes niger]